MTAALEATGLTVGYRRRLRRTIVLDRLDLAVRAGELVCLLGPNGIGKSTLLRTIARIQAPLAGTVLLGGVDIRSIRQLDLARLLGIVTTDRVEVGALSAYRLVALGRYAHQGWGGRLTDEDHAVIRRSIRAVGAEHLADRDSVELSDGERQRINIARALAQEPRVLLLDEPTAFLDVPARVELTGLLRRLAAEDGLAVIVSTHDLELALRTADTAWLVSPGGRFDAGTPEDLVRDGLVADAFRATGIRFDAAGRSFRLVGDGRREAVVRGSGLGAALAAAVLEREGFTVVGEPSGRTSLAVAIDAEGRRWVAEDGALATVGSSFADLAAFARRAAAPRSPAAAA